MRVFQNHQEVVACVGQELALSDWLEITQERVDAFAQATGDHQWIHVDPVRAKHGPFGGTIAHGFLTMSLLAPWIGQCLSIADAALMLNYGFNRLRFPQAVPVGSRLRLRLQLLHVEAIAPNGVQLTLEAKVEIEGAIKPACVAEWLVRSYTGKA